VQEGTLQEEQTFIEQSFETLDDLFYVLGTDGAVSVKTYATMNKIMTVFVEHHGSYQEEIAPGSVRPTDHGMGPV